MPAHLTARHLVKAFGSHFRLDVPFLQVDEGECVGLVGNNGAGKTTLLRLLLDLAVPDAGEVYLDGHAIARTNAWRRDVASFLDRGFLIDFLTPREFFLFVGSLYKRAEAEVEAFLPFFHDLLDPALMAPRAPLVRDLSLGNQKKVGLVAALVCAPRLLVLDEPFANLDPGSQMRLRRVLQQQARDLGTTLLVSSHDLRHVTEICSRIVLIEGGRIVRDVPASPASLPDLEAYFAG